MKKSSFLFTMALGASVFSASAFHVSMRQGQLASLIKDMPADDTELVITGSMDIRDLQTIVASPALQKLDLGKADIAFFRTNAPAYMNRTMFPANELPAYIFMDAQITSVILPESLEIIGEGCFAASAIEKVEMGKSLVEIGDYAFNGCEKLKHVTLPASVSFLGDKVFAGCSNLSTADLSASSITLIPTQTFKGCQRLYSVTFPQHKIALGELAFAGTGLQDLMNIEVSYASPYALAGMTDLRETSLSGNVTAEGLYMGNGNLREVGGGIAMLPDYYFTGCAELFAREQIAENEEIGRGAYAGTGGNYIRFGKNLRSIGDFAFHGMNLTTLDATELELNVPSVTEDSFAGLQQEEIELVVTDVAYWEGQEYWNKFKIVDKSAVQLLPEEMGRDIFIRAENGMIHISASSDISEVTLALADGQLLSVASPGEKSFSMAVPEGSRGKVLLVHVKAGKNVHTAKYLY